MVKRNISDSGPCGSRFSLWTVKSVIVPADLQLFGYNDLCFKKDSSEAIFHASYLHLRCHVR